MEIFSLLNKTVIKSTFQKDFDEFRKTPHHVQFGVGLDIFKNIDYLSNLSPADLAREQVRLKAEFKKMRHANNLLGANSSRDPRYAYPALMESILDSLGDAQLTNKILQDVMGWLALIGVIEK